MDSLQGVRRTMTEIQAYQLLKVMMEGRCLTAMPGVKRVILLRK